MPDVIARKVYGPFTQAQGAQTIEQIGELPAGTLQVSLFIEGTPNAGTLAFEWRPTESNKFATLKDEFGAAISMSMVSPEPIRIRDVDLDALKVTPTGFNGTSYKVIVAVL